MLKESAEILRGNDRFEGFVVDVIDEVSKILGFKYILQMVSDGNYGSIVSTSNIQSFLNRFDLFTKKWSLDFIKDQSTGEWNGIIRELLDGVC